MKMFAKRISSIIVNNCACTSPVTVANQSKNIGVIALEAIALVTLVGALLLREIGR